MTEQVMDTDEFLAHYGVKGMKWGVHRARKPSSSDEIKDARARIQSKQAKLGEQRRAVKKAKKAGDTKAQARAEKKMSDMKVDFLKDPDRITASYLTKGEKVAIGVLSIAAGPVSLAGVAAGRGVEAIARNKVAQRQATGYYDKKK